MQNAMLEKIIKLCPNDRYTVVDLAEISCGDDTSGVINLQKLNADGYVSLKYVDDKEACLIPLKKAFDLLENENADTYENLIADKLKRTVFWGAFIGGIIATTVCAIITAVIGYVIV